MGATVLQELRTSRALEALRDLASPRATVVRDGAQRIAGREVVAGDLLLLAEGDRIAADGLLVECHDLVVDEAMLTGESVRAEIPEWCGGRPARARRDPRGAGRWPPHRRRHRPPQRPGPHR